MSIFNEVAVTWKGREYVVPPDKVFKLIAEIEHHITLDELYLWKGVKRAQLSEIWCDVLRYAARVSGAPLNVDEEEVYAMLFDADFAASTTKMVEALLRMMIPPEHLQLKPAPADSKKKTPPPAKKTRKKVV